MVIQTEHLTLSGGWVYLSRLDGAELVDEDVKLYRYKDGPEWAWEFGEEPAWFEAEASEIEDAVNDMHRTAGEYERTVNTAYFMAQGLV